MSHPPHFYWLLAQGLTPSLLRRSIDLSLFYELVFDGLERHR